MSDEKVEPYAPPRLLSAGSQSAPRTFCWQLLPAIASFLSSGPLIFAGVYLGYLALGIRDELFVMISFACLLLACGCAHLWASYQWLRRRHAIAVNANLAGFAFPVFGYVTVWLLLP